MSLLGVPATIGAYEAFINVWLAQEQRKRNGAMLSFSQVLCKDNTANEILLFVMRKFDRIKTLAPGRKIS